MLSNNVKVIWPNFSVQVTHNHQNVFLYEHCLWLQNSSLISLSANSVGAYTWKIITFITWDRNLHQMSPSQTDFHSITALAAFLHFWSSPTAWCILPDPKNFQTPNVQVFIVNILFLLFSSCFSDRRIISYNTCILHLQIRSACCLCMWTIRQMVGNTWRFIKQSRFKIHNGEQVPFAATHYEYRRWSPL